MLIRLFRAIFVSGLFLSYWKLRLIHTSRPTLPQETFSRTACTAALLCCLCAWLCPPAAYGQDALLSAVPTANVISPAERDASCRIIYLGFVGALEPSQNKHSGVVQIGETLRGVDYPDVCAKSYSPLRVVLSTPGPWPPIPASRFASTALREQLGVRMEAERSRLQY